MSGQESTFDNCFEPTSLERARDNNLALSPRQWKMLELDNFYHSNIWRYTKEHQLFAKEPYVWLMSIISPMALKHTNEQVENLNDTFVVKEILGVELGISPRHKPFVQWINDQEISWRQLFVKAEDVYSNSCNCYGIIFKRQEDLLLTKMMWV